MNILDFLTNGQASQLDSNGDGVQRLVANLMLQRSELMKSLLDSPRDVDADCGYPSGYISTELYKLLYDREPLATRTVEVYPKESWQIFPSVFEEEDVEKITQFEEAWDALGKQLRGEQSFYQEEEASTVWTYLSDADIKSGIGHYAGILLGLDDGAPLNEPVDMITPAKGGTTQNVSGESASRRLLFLRVFGETDMRINSLETDMQSPRYGQPTEYDISLIDPTEFTSLGLGASLPTNRAVVHWSRVVHISEYGVLHTPRMQPVLNRLLDLRKLYGGSAEMFWRGAFPGYAIKTQPQLGADVDLNRKELETEITNYSNSLQRFLILMGMDVTALAPQVSDPASQIDKQIEAICIQLGVPKRIFMGSERGELASSQDDAAFDDRLKQRQLGVITPRIIIPFVDRLIATRVLPRPTKGYRVSWPDLTSKSDEEKAGIATQRTQAIAAYVAGQLETTLAPMDFWTRIMGFTEDESQSIIDNAEEIKAQKEKEQAAKDAEAARVQAEAQAKIDAAAKTAADTPSSEQTPTAPGSPTSPGKAFGGKGGPSPTSTPPGASVGQPGSPNTVGNSDVGNAFCPTGPGGGIDPSCSPKSTGSTGGSGEVKHIAHDSKDLVKLREEVSSFPAGPRREEAIQALKPSRHDVVITLRHEGSLVGVASVWKTPDTAEEGMPPGQYIRIRNMATARAGTGKALLSEIYHHAASQGAGVYLSSLSGSSRFYETSGFNSGVGSTWYLTASQVKSKIPTENFDPSQPRDANGKWERSGNTESKADVQQRHGDVASAESRIKESGLADSVSLNGMTHTEAHAVADVLGAALHVAGHQLKLRSVSVVDKLPVAGEAGGLGYSSGHIYITKKFLDTAREHDRSKVEEQLRGTGGERNFAWQAARSPEDAVRIAVAHEVGHHVDTSLLLDLAKGMRDTKDSGAKITEPDMLQVSAYATHHVSEAFPEVHSLMSTGHGAMVPASVRTFYEKALATADPEPIPQFLRQQVPIAHQDYPFHSLDNLDTNAKAALSGGRWVTIEGRHVYLKGGKIVAGPPDLKGETLASAQVKVSGQTKEPTAKGAAEPKAKPGKATTTKPQATTTKPESSKARTTAETTTAPDKEHTTPNRGLPDQARPTLHEHEARAIKGYTIYAKELNASLRSGDKLSEMDGKIHEGLTSAFGRAKDFKEPVSVYRGMRLPASDQGAFLKRITEAHAKGEEITIPGYMSTSTSQKEAKAFATAYNFPVRVVLEVKAKRGLDLQSFSYVPEQKEFLLDHNSKFTVGSVKKRGELTYVTLEHK